MKDSSNNVIVTEILGCGLSGAFSSRLGFALGRFSFVLLEEDVVTGVYRIQALSRNYYSLPTTYYLLLLITPSISLTYYSPRSTYYFLLPTALLLRTAYQCTYHLLLTTYDYHYHYGYLYKHQYHYHSH